MSKLSGILIVDDDHTNNFLSEIIIQDMGITDHIYSAYNGEEALTFLHNKYNSPGSQSIEGWPELILLDINMPVMNGFEFLEAFEKTNLPTKEMTIVLLTSSDNPHDLEMAKRYRITSYLNKPLNEEKVNNILALIRANRTV